MNVIGINAYHGDSSACLMQDGKVICAVEEERFKRVKHWAGFPEESVRYCMSVAGLSIDDVDYFAVNSDPAAHKNKKIVYALKQFSPSFIRSHLKNLKAKQSLPDDMRNAFGAFDESRLIHVEHHLSHLASAYYASGFDTAVALSVDGFGDFSSASWGLAEEEIVIDDYVHFPHSLGIFYQAMTQFLGFMHYGDEYKIMGMAAYGKPVYADKIFNIIQSDEGKFKLNLDYFSHHKGSAKYRWINGVPECDNLFSDALTKLLGPQRDPKEEITQEHKDYAASIQHVYESIFFDMLKHLNKKYPNVRKLVLSGGCAMNSLANGKIRQNSQFEEIYIPPAAGDAGGAVGAASIVSRQKARQAEKAGVTEQMLMDHAYLGCAYSDNDYQEVLKDIDEQVHKVSHITDNNALYNTVCDHIIAGNVIGWFDEEMEWGPRALGHRSILADPRRNDMRDILNIKIKLRESFRPFAPSVLSDQVSEWFEQDLPVPFMSQVFKIKADKREQIPAVTHLDGTGRLQTVDKKTNQRYYDLISCFFEKTGVPMIINTSFNENEPIVCTPQQALSCYLRTNMDVLVLGNYVVSRIV